MRDWGCHLTVVLTADGQRHYPIGTLCAVVAPTMTARHQADRLREHAALRRYVHGLSVHTRGGPQIKLCLDERGIAFWLGTLPQEKIRPALRERLIEWQVQLVELADQHFRDVTLTPTTEVIVNRLDRHERALDHIQAFTRTLAQRMGHLEEHIQLPPDDDEES